jgi:predicted TPR repeat methyltransferase
VAKTRAEVFFMQELTSKELEIISDVLTAEGLICKKARAYSKTLTDVELADCMTKIADEHEQRYNALLKIIGG